MLRSFVLGFLAGLPAGFLSALGVPVGLVLVHAGIHMPFSSIIINYSIHVALNTLFWTVLGIFYAWKKKKWVGLAGFLTGVAVAALSVVFLVLLFVIVGEILGELTIGL